MDNAFFRGLTICRPFVTFCTLFVSKIQKHSDESVSYAVSINHRRHVLHLKRNRYTNRDTVGAVG